LSDAINATSSGTWQIWVADGVYYPDEGNGITNNDQAASFQLKQDVAIYGGFFGIETSIGQRSPRLNVTILSGDIDQNDTANFGNRGNNSLHVVKGETVNATARLDGFRIRGGNADGGDFPDGYGGGVFLNVGSAA
jgi:hypothetical protein